MEGNLASVVFSFIIMFAIGALSWPYDYNLMVLGFLYTTWWSLCIALLIACLSERFEIVHRIWPPIGYLYIFFSGFLFMADWLPTQVRELGLPLSPPLHCYEMVRGGLFGDKVIVYYDIPYLTLMLAILTVIGLWLLHNVRQYIEIE